MLGVGVPQDRPLSSAFSTRDAGRLSGTTALKWFLIQTRNCQERRAAEFLGLWAAETLLPLVDEIKRITKERQPLFTGYVFSRFEPGQVSKANGTFGVARVVRFGQEAAVVEDSLIEEIRGRLDAAGVLVIKAAAVGCGPKEFRRGELVQVTSGPFAGVTGMFDCQRNGSERARLMLERVQAGGGWSSSRKPVQAVGPAIGVTVNIRDLRRVG